MSLFFGLIVLGDWHGKLSCHNQLERLNRSCASLELSLMGSFVHLNVIILRIHTAYNSEATCSARDLLNILSQDDGAVWLLW